MDSETFRRHGHEVIDWVADYLENVGQYPVLAQVEPGDVRRQLPTAPPEAAESMDRILEDFRQIILPGVTHWNHPRFFAYFPANNSGPSILAELLSAALGVNAMVWQTCPAATELEELVMDWLRQLLDLPGEFRGVIQDTASTGTVCAFICAREKATGFEVNRSGFAAAGPLRVYTSGEANSSIEKGAKIAGFGFENVVKVNVGEHLEMDPADLERRIEADLKAGLKPCCVVATVGTTSSTAIDPVAPLAEICRRHGLWLHVDAAMAGNAAILPEKRWLIDGCAGADSFVFNPHKWLFTNFDCSAYFTRDPEILQNSLSIVREYLKTGRGDEVTNFRDWTIPLGRRFRALKLWFVLRSFGSEGLRARLREHLKWAEEFAGWVAADPDFELLAPLSVNTVCFRLRPGAGVRSLVPTAGFPGTFVDGDPPPAAGAAPLPELELERMNKAVLDEVNSSGRIYLTHTKLTDRYTLRLVVGQTRTRREDVQTAWNCLRDTEAVRAVRSQR